jgi:hypothetical protein
MSESTWAFVYFFSFFFLSNYILLNLFVAVILGLHPIVTLEKQVLNMIGSLV